MHTLRLIALGFSGLFSLLLGTAHFFFPILLDFKKAIPQQGGSLKPFRLGPIRYATKRTDVYGIAWVMNHAASFVLVSIGLFNLLAFRWLGEEAGRWLSWWIAGWWLLRAGSQFYLGRRRGDWFIAAGFLLLAVVQVAAVWP